MTIYTKSLGWAPPDYSYAQEVIISSHCVYCKGLLANHAVLSLEKGWWCR